ncbi:MAG: 50S ribosomal protein L25 [Planctomycetaceae bacterium]
MTIQAKLVATKRTENGSKQCRRLRLGGVIPGVLYGHETEPVAISVPRDALAPIVKAATRIVDLELDGTTEKAMFREVQWDTFGMYMHHFDLLRINPDERVVVEVNIEVKGTPAGVLSGGLLEINMRHIELECLAIEIPDSIVVRVGDLQIDQGIHISDLELPPNVKVLEKPDALVLHVVKVEVSDEDLTTGEAGPAEPEVIGRKAAEESEDDAK